MPSADLAVKVVMGVVVGIGLVAYYTQAWRSRRARRVRVTTAPRREPVDVSRLFAQQARVERIATLHVPTGQMLACDPLTQVGRVPPLARRAPIGDHAVDICVVDGRVAAARVVFADREPVTWELAEDNEYLVDTGLGCFMDVAASDGAIDITDELLGLWLDHHPVPGRAANCVIVASGDGDGIYATYWGLDGAGQPVQLVTDFEILD